MMITTLLLLNVSMCVTIKLKIKLDGLAVRVETIKLKSANNIFPSNK